MRAVDDVSFSVGRGEIAGLLGPNGSGKTTVMRILTGFFSPTAGRVVVDGVDVGASPLAARRRVGYLPEQVALYPDLTVRRFLGFVAGVRGLGGQAARRAVTEVLERCALGEVADRLTGRLSKGFRQRVGLAQALIGDPEVLVLDEPTGGLDPVQTVEFRAVLRSLTGRTILLSTHLLAEASILCSRVIVLRHGRVLAEDSAEGLSRQLAADMRVSVRVEGVPRVAAGVLRGLPGVTAVSEVAGSPGPGVCFDVRAQDALDVQRAAVPALLAAGCGVLELVPRPPSLEDLFLRLVERADGTA